MNNKKKNINKNVSPKKVGSMPLENSSDYLIKKDFLPISITILFTLIIGLGMFFHELWRDELEIYSRLAFTNHVLMEGDISSICYYAFLKCFMLISNSEAMFQIAHLLILIPAIYLFVKYANISNLQKLLFVCSYFVVYDYGIISRYYGFMMLLLFIIVFLLTKKEKNYVVIVALLLLLANHTIQSTIFAACLSGYLVLETFHRYLKKKIVFDYKLITAITLFIVGWSAILLSHYFFTLKNASYMGNGQFGSAPFFINIKSIWNAFVPIPDLNSGAAFWNTNIVNYIMIFPTVFNSSDYVTLPNILTFLVSVYIIVAILAKFSEKPLVFVTFFLNIIIYLAFLQYTRVYFLRYQGLLFIIFMYNYWLYKNSDVTIDWKLFTSIESFFKQKSLLFLKKSFTPLLYLILCSQVFSAYYAFSKDMKYKFSMSQDAAKYITVNNLNKTHVMVGFIDYAAQTIAAHTKTKIFFPQVNHFSYYQEPFNKLRKPYVPFPEIIAACTDFTEKQNKNVLLILNFPLTDNKQQLITEGMLSQHSKMKLLQSFSGDVIQPDEQFWLYEATKVSN